jgi:hypothetical protein
MPKSTVKQLVKVKRLEKNTQLLLKLRAEQLRTIARDSKLVKNFSRASKEQLAKDLAPIFQTVVKDKYDELIRECTQRQKERIKKKSETETAAKEFKERASKIMPKDEIVIQFEMPVRRQIESDQRDEIIFNQKRIFNANAKVVKITDNNLTVEPIDWVDDDVDDIVRAEDRYTLCVRYTLPFLSRKMDNERWSREYPCYAYDGVSFRA